MMSAIRWRDTSKLAVPAIASRARLPAHQALRPAAIEIAMATHPGTSPHCHSIDRVCRKPNGLPERARLLEPHARAAWTDSHKTRPRICPVKGSQPETCLLYTSDAADDLLCVDLGGR